jgi:tetratricopeptide (TPR) repeat protein
MLITLTKFTPTIKYYDKALAKNHNATDILNNRCLSFLHLEKYNESLKVFEKVLSIDPNDASSLYNKGIALDKLGNHTQAHYYQQKAQ